MISRIINNLTFYDLVSGWIPCLTLLAGLAHYLHGHTCSEPRCCRPVKHSTQHCRKHRR